MTWFCGRCNAEFETKPVVCGTRTAKGEHCSSTFFWEQADETPGADETEFAIRPWRRKSSWYKKNFHTGEIGCVLFAVKKNQTAALEIGNKTKASGNQRNWSSHAEKQWWSDELNLEKLRELASDPDLIHLEFEVSGDFCDKGCRGLFREIRDYLKGNKIPVYIFMIREEIYYEVNAQGEVLPKGQWGDA